MSFDRRYYTTLAALTALSLTACHPKTETETEPPATQQVGDVVALSESGRLISFNRADPKILVGSVMVTGLPAGESVLGMDYRPADSQLYALTSGGKLFTLKPETGVATLKSTLTAMSGDDNPFTGVGLGNFGVDFNPVADRLRVVSSTGLNLRVNVDTGETITDGTLHGPNNVKGAFAAAYTNSVKGATSTQLYVLWDETLYLQDPPNSGTLTEVGNAPSDVSGGNGYDIDGRTNVGYLLVTLGGTPFLNSIEPGKSRQLSEIGQDISDPFVGMALR